ncbi:MAG: hypothetical protein KBD63_02760 [Bacteriovoracaceae bacterium]|nr:hypothetical protein [Bacteriovoracaceae bacterium]
MKVGLKNIFFMALFFSLSCARIVQVFEKDRKKKQSLQMTSLSVKKKKEKEIICSSAETQISFAGLSVENQQIFEKILQEKLTSFSSPQKAILWILFQMQTLSHIHNPSAGLQIFILKQKGQQQDSFFFNTTNQQKENPSLHLLYDMLKKTDPSISLASLEQTLSKNLPSKLFLEEGLYHFLKDRTTFIEKSLPLKERYLLSGEPLENQDKIAPLSSSPALKEFMPLEDVTLSSLKPTTIWENSPLLSSCNEKNSPSTILSYESAQHFVHPFAFYEKKGDESFFMLGVSSIQYAQTGLQEEKGLLKGDALHQVGVFCSLKNANGQSLGLISLKEKDPFQHIKHLDPKSLMSLQSLSHLSKWAGSPRYEYLNSPPRLLLEGTQLSRQQLQSFLQENTPVYDASPLGLIWGFGILSHEEGLFLDPRTFFKGEKLSCLTP